MEVRRSSGQLGQPGAPIAEGDSDALGAVTLTLPAAADAALVDATRTPDDVAHLSPELSGPCAVTPSSSDATARIVIGSEYRFSTSEGGGSAAAYRLTNSMEKGVELDLLVFSTRATTVTGPLTCGSFSKSVDDGLSAGWNLRRVTAARGTSSISALPLDTVIQVTR